MSAPMSFWRGKHLYQIAPAYEGSGYMGLCDGRVVATASNRPAVMRIILMAGAWDSMRRAFNE